ncbi:8230_t:CDS:1 [Paraglomus occultum]|uniref:Transcription initiation factor IIF subunit alpha n=1 Tax=Paraglomus occultum TaxID=144539 RepID=A0A9N8ZXV1_9GLOM|nr:8230_t:CDS:1 [Paraglomus occultum]
MNFISSKRVDPSLFTPPVKLVRRDPSAPPRNQATASPVENATLNTPTPGPSAKAPGTDTSQIAPYGNATRNRQNLFKKKTKQVHIAPEESRKLRAEEEKPWVLEDYDGTNTYIGELEGGQRANYALFLLTDDGFKVVCVDKWYKFKSKIRHRTLTIEEAEEAIAKAAKRDNDRWMMHKWSKSAEDEQLEAKEGGIFDRKSTLKTVETYDDDLFGEEDDEEAHVSKRKVRGDVDEEWDFDEVFEDDEEAPAEVKDEEEKEVERRQKKSMRKGSDDEDMEEEVPETLTSTGKQMKKLVRSLEENEAYVSDKEEDPYASSVEEEDTEDEEKSSGELGKTASGAATQKPPQIAPKSKTGGTNKAGTAPQKTRPTAGTKLPADSKNKTAVLSKSKPSTSSKSTTDAKGKPASVAQKTKDGTKLSQSHKSKSSQLSHQKVSAAPRSQSPVSPMRTNVSVNGSQAVSPTHASSVSSSHSVKSPTGTSDVAGAAPGKTAKRKPIPPGASTSQSGTETSGIPQKRSLTKTSTQPTKKLKSGSDTNVDVGKPVSSSKPKINIVMGRSTSEISAESSKSVDAPRKLKITTSASSASSASSAASQTRPSSQHKPPSQSRASTQTGQTPRPSPVPTASSSVVSQSRTSTQTGPSRPSPVPTASSSVITEAEVVRIISSSPQMTTRQLIKELKDKIKKDDQNRAILRELVARVGVISGDGYLVLKNRD